MPGNAEVELRTARLLLRPPRLEDLDPWAAMMADEAVAPRIGGVQPLSQVWRSLMCVAGAWHLAGHSMFSVIERSSGRWIGRLGPWSPAEWPGNEIGWAIVRDCWGRGYATEGASAAADWAFEQLGWTDMIHVIAPDNVASQAVARKLGSQNRGPGRLPPPWNDVPVELWGQSREQWRHRSGLQVLPPSVP
jgi:RimJ/RimL family protein N-acetyltransferase